MLDKYLDSREMSALVRDAAPKHRDHYKLFSLEPEERGIIHKI